MSPFLVAPSLLSADFANLSQEIKSVLSAGADWLHVDVMDGHFVPNLTMGPAVIKSVRACTTAVLDCHLMVTNPEHWVEAFAEAGADYFTFHIETTTDPVELIKQIRAHGMKPGITLRPKTNVQDILPYVAHVDLVLIMTVEPGFSGQGFMTNQIEKIHQVREVIDELKLNTLIEVDGGVTDKTALKLKDADVLVAGNFIFKNNYVEAIRKLKAIK